MHALQPGVHATSLAHAYSNPSAALGMLPIHTAECMFQLGAGSKHRVRNIN